VDLLKVSDNVLDYYRNNVRGNEKITLDQLQRKLTRNMKLAHKEDSAGYRNQMYKYGSLWFTVCSRGKVRWIKNKCNMPVGWMLDKKEYIRLSKELGIEDYNTYTIEEEAPESNWNKIKGKLTQGYVSLKNKLNVG